VKVTVFFLRAFVGCFFAIFDRREADLDVMAGWCKAKSASGISASSSRGEQGVVYWTHVSEPWAWHPV